MIISKDLAKWMKQRRKFMNKSYDDIAKELGVSKASLVKMFYAQSNFSEQLIVKVLEYLGHSDIGNTIKNLINNQEKIKNDNYKHTLPIKESIKQQLKDNNIEPVTLANKMGVSRQYIHRILNVDAMSNKMAKKINKTIDEIVAERRL